MQLPHAVAVVLLGWYLMLPPVNVNGVDVSAPVSRWIKYKDYDSVAGCTLARTELFQRAEQAPAEPPLEFTVRQLEQFAGADCVAADDPRLRATQHTSE